MRSCLVLCLAGLAAGGCTTPPGNLQVFVEAEDTIPEGLMPGAGGEAIVDGWTVTYDKFLVAIGNFRAARSASADDRLTAPEVYVVDLLHLPTAGFVLARFDDVAALRYDRVGFDLPNASAAAIRPDFTAPADHDLLVQNGWSIYFEARLENPTGVQCTPGTTTCTPRSAVTIKWGLAAGTAFDDCAPPMGDAGFAVPAGGTVQVKPTIHGDHWFFTNLTQGAEVTERRAQWIADSDLDKDGETTLAELAQVRAAEVFPSKLYNLTGAIIPIQTARDYLEAQARTLGDYQGEGECPTRKVLN